MAVSTPGGPGSGHERGAGPPGGVLLMLTGDPLVRRRLSQLAAEHGLTLAEAAGPPQPGPGPAVAVIDLDQPGALDQVRDWRARWPGALLAGHLAEPDRDRWVAAQRAGCDVVANRGALALRLRQSLGREGAPGARSFPLLAAADAAGRLGLVHRAAETPVGPVAVYRVDGRLRAVADRCPHAGAALSAGEVDGAVITCPGHGSRFDLRTGERLRGPADADAAVFTVAAEGGQICLPLRGQGPGQPCAVRLGAKRCLGACPWASAGRPDVARCAVISRAYRLLSDSRLHHPGPPAYRGQHDRPVHDR